jgi:2-dehydro-3-deoxyphosphogalactonate aldolase
MEIRNVETHIVGTPEPHKGGHNFLFIKLETADGLVGYGECPWTEFRTTTIAHLIEEFADGFIIGSSPFDIEWIRRKLYRSNPMLHVPGPLQAQLIAGVEMACWDLIGKRVGEPIYNLIGGSYRDEIRSYTYLHYEWEPPESPEAAAEAAASYHDQGFTGIKLDPIPPYEGPRELSLEELNYTESVISAIRDAVGESCDIIIGTHGQLTTADAIRFAQRLESYDPLWFEEPVPPERPDEMADVAERTSIPIATGERLTTVHQAAELLERDAVDVLQPNLGLVGISGAKKMAGMAEANYVQMAPWMYSGPILWAANLHFDAATPNFLIQEGIERWEEFHAELVQDAPDWNDGSIKPPSGPGLGIELDEQVLSDYPANKQDLSEFSWF